MKDNKFGFIQGRMTSPPSKKTLQYFPKKNWRREFRLAKKYGFNFIEFFAERKFNRSNPIWNVKKLREINNLVRKNNLFNYSFCDDFFIKNNINNFQNLENYYDKISNNLSIINIRIYVLALFEKSMVVKKNYKNFVKTLQIIADKLKNKNIKLALETNLDVISIKKLIHLINRNNVFLVYDTGNRLKKGNLQFNEIIKLKNHICHFHLKDKNWKGQNVILGTGAVNLNAIFSAIKKIKFKGNFVFETNRGHNPIQTMVYNKKYILSIIISLLE